MLTVIMDHDNANLADIRMALIWGGENFEIF